MHTGFRVSGRAQLGLVFVVLSGSGCDLEGTWNKFRHNVAERIIALTQDPEDTPDKPTTTSPSTPAGTITLPERRETQARRYASCRFDLWSLYARMMESYRDASFTRPDPSPSNTARCTALAADPEATGPGFRELVQHRRTLVDTFNQLENLLNKEDVDRSRVDQATRGYLAADEAFQRQLDELHETNDPQFLRLRASRESSVSYHAQAILVAARSVVRCRERNLRAGAMEPEGARAPSGRGWSEACRAMAHTFEATWAEFQGALSRHTDQEQRRFWLAPLTNIADGFRVELRETIEESRRLRPRAAKEMPSHVELKGVRIHLARLRSAAEWVDGASNTEE